MRVLVACECSGRVRDAFAVQGHDAWSCDLQPAAGQHIQADVLEVLSAGWDLMIAHPPCTYLSNVGANWLYRQPGRLALREQALAFFMRLVNAPVARICIENPVGYPNKAFRQPDQIIHPYYFGDPEMKRTCLWLKGLPKLWYWHEDDLFGKRTSTGKPKPLKVCADGRRLYFTDAQPGNRTQAQTRSITFPSVAAAMAEQWGCL